MATREETGTHTSLEWRDKGDGDDMRIVALLVVVWMLTACASSSNGESDIELSMLRYEKAWRWNNAEMVSRFHLPEAYDPQALAQLSRIRIGNYEVLNRRYLDKDNMTQRVRFTYYFNDDIRVKKMEVEQAWVLDGTLKRWIITSPVPVLK